MTLLAAAMPKRRGACPGLFAPMQTGDGLLVRLVPKGTISLHAFADLCAAGRRYGNGIIEVTSRGSIQVRGLNAISAPQFAAAIAALDMAAGDAVSILGNPLGGLDAQEIFDATGLVADLRSAIAQRGLAARLSPKVSVVIDSAGAIDLETIPADIRLHAHATEGDLMLRVSVGGDQARAAELGQVAPAQGIETVIRLLEVIARRGRDVRAREILAREGVEVFLPAIRELLLPGQDGRSLRRERGVALGSYPLRDETMARGVALAFGHADASALEELAGAAKTTGASSLRTAPGCVLLAIGLAAQSVSSFASAAEQLGFVTGGNDPRLRVIACSGAPICASAHLPARALAPVIARNAVGFAGTIHVSGCAKGCAQNATAALTIVGTPEGCALIADGSPHDVPFAVVTASELAGAVQHHVRERRQEDAHG